MTSRYPRFEFKIDEKTGEVIMPRWSGRLNEKGEEVLDPTPVAIPVGFERPPTLEAQIERIMALSERRQALSGELLDEDDFPDGDEDDLPETKHQAYLTKAHVAEMDSFINEDVNKKLSKSKKASAAPSEPQPAPPEAGAGGDDPQ